MVPHSKSSASVRLGIAPLKKPLADIMRWERALNGRAVRVLHSVNEGAYGGETLYMWDAKKEALTYHYFTTAGFTTTGTLTVKDGKFISHEVVSGSAGGVTEVRATSELLPDGTFLVKTEHLKDGKYKAAIKSFKRAIKENPNHAMAYNNMAYSYRKLGQFDEAIALYEKALAIDPNLAEAHEYMGEALIAVGRIEDAKKHLAILEKLDPKLAEELREEITRHQRS